MSFSAPWIVDQANCDGVVLTPAEWVSVNALAAPEPFDYVTAGGIWGLAFTFVVGLYLVSKNAGTILSMIGR